MGEYGDKALSFDLYLFWKFSFLEIFLFYPTTLVLGKQPIGKSFVRQVNIKPEEPDLEVNGRKSTLPSCKCALSKLLSGGYIGPINALRCALGRGLV